jgi:hypothetical protein
VGSEGIDWGYTSFLQSDITTNNPLIIAMFCYLAEKSVAWPRHEVQALQQATLAGQSEDQRRALVKALVAERATALSMPSKRGANK